jgi:predicted enzyme related to lactoylglutathione lyase
MEKLDYWEIPTTDCERTARFLAELFGWKVTPSTDRYFMASVEGGIDCGIQQADAPPEDGIRVYMGVEDIPATLARVTELGGTVVTPKTEIGGGYGYWADFREPGGCKLGLWSRA